MATKVTPFCDVNRMSRHQSGNVKDFGFCFTERPQDQLMNPEYTFDNFTLEPNTNTLLVKPEISYYDDSFRNGLNRWTVHPETDWVEIEPPGYPEGRKMIKFINTNPYAQYTASSSYNYATNEPIIVELGLLPSRNVNVKPWVRIYLGDNVRVFISKNVSPIVEILDAYVWKYVGCIDLDFSPLWNDVGTHYLWFIPYKHGLLTSSNGTAFVFLEFPIEVTMLNPSVSISSSGGVAAYGLHAVKYYPATISSGPIKRGYKPLNEPDIAVRGWIDETDGSLDASIHDSSDLIFNYGVTLTPGKQQMGVSKVSINYPPTLIVTQAIELTVSDIQDVDENIPEDPSEETTVIRIANPEFIHSGEFKRFDEIEWYFGWHWSDGASEPILRNTGVVKGVRETRGVSGESLIELTCKAPLDKLKDGTVIYAPDYSGWLIEDALKDFLLRNGIPEDKQSIYAWGLRLPELEEGGAQPVAGTKSWDWLDDVVCKIYGGWIYTTRAGIIRIEPEPVIEDEGWENPFVISINDLESIEYQETEEALENFYNDITVFGLAEGPKWVASHIRNYGSLFDPDAADYVGYIKPYVWTVPFYPITKEYCDSVCQTLYTRSSKIRLGMTVTTDTMSGECQIYPSARVKIEADSGVSDYMIVKSVTSRMSHGSFQQVIFGNYVKM